MTTPLPKTTPRAIGEPPLARPGYGLMMAVIAAVMYSLANVSLRQLAERKDLDYAFLVMACKAVATAVVAWLLIARGWTRNINLLPPIRFYPQLLIAAFCTAVLGNVVFQYALTIGGLAIVMPTVFAMIILTGAMLGWLVLREPVSPMLAAAMAVLISAIIVLSFGADDAAEAAAGSRRPAAAGWVIATGIVSGFGYGCVGVIVRKTRLAGVSAAGTLVLISTSGVVGLGAVALARLGWSTVAAAIAVDGVWLAAASVCNAVAFFAIAEAYEHLAVVRVNLVNSSQSAMCAIAGVVVFAEPATGWLVFGTVLTLFGLAMVAYAKDRT